MSELSTWHNWNVMEQLGRGSYGSVYRIERTLFGHTEESALKVIRIPQNRSDYESLLSEGYTKRDASAYYRGMAENFTKEFALMTELKGNSNIVSIEDCEVIEEDDGYSWTIYLRMELLKPLTKWLREHTVTEEDVVRIGQDICSALELCERIGILHRDVKPENVFYSEQGSFKLGDFGVARKFDNAGTATARQGALSYMAPEVYKGRHYDTTADIYSLGLMLYRLLNNNRMPFLPPYPQPVSFADREHANIRRMSGDPIPPPCNAGRQLADVILRDCAYRPEDRYQNAADLRAAILAAASGEDPERNNVQESPAPPLQPKPKKVGTAIIAAVCVAAVAIGGILYATRPASPEKTEPPDGVTDETDEESVTEDLVKEAEVYLIDDGDAYDDYMILYYGQDTDLLYQLEEQIIYLPGKGYTKDYLENFDLEEIYPKGINDLDFVTKKVTEDEDGILRVSVCFRHLDELEHIRALSEIGMLSFFGGEPALLSHKTYAAFEEQRGSVRISSDEFENRRLVIGYEE